MKRMNKMLPGLRAKAAETAEQALLQALPVEPARLQRIVKHLNPKELKRIALAAVGAGLLVSLLGTVGQNRLCQAAMARELKKQLAPVNRKLEALEAQNEELKRQNEELKQQLQAQA